MDEGFDRDQEMRPRFSPKPVKLGDKVNVKVENIGEKGDGVAKVEGFVIFVKGATQEDVGKELDVNITFVGRKFAIAEKA